MLQKSGCWCDRYAENQDLVNKNSSVMKEQADMIATLEEQKGPDGRGGKGDKRRIRELESDVENLKVPARLHTYIEMQQALH